MRFLLLDHGNAFVFVFCERFGGHFPSPKEDRITTQQPSKSYVGVLISLWLFLFAAQPKEFFLDELKKLVQRSHKSVELRGTHQHILPSLRSIKCNKNQFSDSRVTSCGQTVGQTYEGG
jgi:hypothetical protein